MKKILIALFCAFHFITSAQQQFTAPVPHWNGAPSGAPSSQGAMIRYSITDGKLYSYNGSTWILQPDGIAQVSGLLPPAFTPGVAQSQFAINAANELYRWSAGTTWDCLNCGSLALPSQRIGYGSGAGVISDAGFIRNTNGDVLVLGANANISVGTPDTLAKITAHSPSGATLPLFALSNTSGVNRLYRSNVSPEGVITANPGDITMSSAGAFIKRAGVGNTGWSELQQRAGEYAPLQKTDAAALNNELYFSTTQNALSYKTSAGVTSYKGQQKSKMTVIETDLSGVGTGQSYPGMLPAAASGGTIAVVSASANHPGVAALRDGTTANAGYGIGTNAQALLLAGGEAGTFVFQDRNTTTRATSIIRMGFFDSFTSASPTDGAYVQIQGGVLAGICRNNNVQAATSTTFPVAQSTWYSLTVNVVSTSLVRFTVFSDAGAQLWTSDVTTNIPTATGRETGFGAFAYESTTDAAADILHLDYLLFQTDRFLIR